LLRLGLCCLFVEQPVRFRTTTVTYLARLGQKRWDHLNQIALDNLELAIAFCIEQGIGAFRVVSSLLPCSTHPQWGYRPQDLDPAVIEGLQRCGEAAKQLRLTFHPDQFVVLNSPKKEVVEKSVADLLHHAELAEILGADLINIHGGGAYGDKQGALEHFAQNYRGLPMGVKQRLTLENDDRVFTPSDLLPLCMQLGIPLVYDVHHHRCLPDGLSEEEATQKALETWDRSPCFHVSSPLDEQHRRQHHDFVSAEDVPRFWKEIDMTLDVEAKAKEVAVLELRRKLVAKGWSVWKAPHLHGESAP